VTDLRVAIIGFGVAGRYFHGPLVAATPGLEVAAVVTSDPDRQAEARQEHPNAQIISRAAEVWEVVAPDVVVVATPNQTHASLATEAIERAVPVVVDKPLAVSAAEAQALVDRAERAGVLLTVFQNRRWDSDQLTLSRLIREGRLGTVLRYESRFERWRPEVRADAWRESAAPEEGGGQLLDLGSHLVDQALRLLGPASHVYAEIDARRGTPGDDDAFLALRHAGDAVSHLHASAITAAPGPRLRVLGSQAAFLVAELDSQEDQLRAGVRPDRSAEWGVEPESRWGRLVTGEHSELVPSERGDWPRFYAELEAAVRSGGAPPVDPRDAVTTLRVLEAARRSAVDRSVVALSE
jgi:scyllo-inositol 2-dehydrogenase (NADP+)